MTNKLFFSIIVAVYNIEDYLSSCVDSIVNQDYKNLELILVDDGSKDGSGALCDELEKKHPGVVRAIHKPNGGLSDARNAGTKDAKGDYIIFIDGDDYVDRDMLSNMVKCIEKAGGSYPDVILSECLCKVDENGIVTKEPGYNRLEFQDISGMDALRKTAPVRANWSACGKAYRLDFWRKHGFAFEKHRSWEDFQLIDKVVLEAKKVCMVPSFYYYLYRTSSITHNVKDKDIRDILKSMDEWDEYLDKKKPDPELEGLIRNRIAVLFCQTVMGYASIATTTDRPALLKAVSEHKGILKSARDKAVRSVYLFSRVFGFINTCRILGFIKKKRYGVK